MLVNEGGNQRGNGGERMGVKEAARRSRNKAFRHQNEHTDAVFWWVDLPKWAKNSFVSVGLVVCLPFKVKSCFFLIPLLIKSLF